MYRKLYGTKGRIVRILWRLLASLMIERVVFSPRLESRSRRSRKLRARGIRVFIDDGHYLPAKHGTFLGYGGGCIAAGKINPIDECVFRLQLDNPDAYAFAFATAKGKRAIWVKRDRDGNTEKRNREVKRGRNRFGRAHSI